VVAVGGGEGVERQHGQHRVPGRRRQRGPAPRHRVGDEEPGRAGGAEQEQAVAGVADDGAVPEREEAQVAVLELVPAGARDPRAALVVVGGEVHHGHLQRQPAAEVVVGDGGAPVLGHALGPRHGLDGQLEDDLGEQVVAEAGHGALFSDANGRRAPWGRH
jgi:hypothetical protein